ncbi:MAG: hemin receptor, partial [Xylanibacter rarus]
MRRLLIIFASTLFASYMSAQETYENANIAGEDLNGTARYVGMGGALDALGADISTIGTNPAGIGLFRHSMANVSFGFVSQQ